MKARGQLIVSRYHSKTMTDLSLPQTQFSSANPGATSRAYNTSLCYLSDRQHFSYIWDSGSLPSVAHSHVYSKSELTALPSHCAPGVFFYTLSH